MTADKLPFCVWQIPGGNYLPLVDYKNSDGENKIFLPDELTWNNASPGALFMDALMLQIRESKASMDAAVRKSVGKLAGSVEKEQDLVTCMPTTPHGIKKKKCHRRQVEKIKSIDTAPMSTRKSSRISKQSMQPNSRVSIQVNAALSSLGFAGTSTTFKQKGKKNMDIGTSEIVTFHESNPSSMENQPMDVELEHSPHIRGLIKYHEKAITEAKDVTGTPAFMKGNASHIAIENCARTIIEESACKTPCNKKHLEVQGHSSSKLLLKSSTNEPKHHELQIKRKTGTTESVTSQKRMSQTIRDVSALSESSMATIDSEDLASHIDIQSPAFEKRKTRSGNLQLLSIPSSDSRKSSIRHSTRLRSLRSSIKESSTKVLDGLAAKRKSTRRSFHTRSVSKHQNTQKLNVHQDIEELDEFNSDGEEVMECGLTSPNKVLEKSHFTSKTVKPKIVKPVIKSKKLATTACSNGKLKRTRDRMAGDGSFDQGNNFSDKQVLNNDTPQQKRPRNVVRMASFLNRSTAASRARRTPVKASPAGSRFDVPLLPNPTTSNINSTIKSFLLRNTPEKLNKEKQTLIKKKLLEEKQKKEDEQKRKREEERQLKIAETKRKRDERAKRAIQMREARKKADKERQNEIQDRWEQRIADADRNKNQLKVEQNAKMCKEMEKLAKAETKRKEEEEEKIKRIQVQQLEREAIRKQRLDEKKLAKLEERRRKEEKRLKEEQQKQEELAAQERETARKKMEEIKRLEEARQIEEAKEIEEAKRIEKEQEQLKAIEEEKRQKKMEIAKKREELRRKVEEERKQKESIAKQKIAMQKNILQEQNYYQQIKEAEERVKMLQNEKSTSQTNLSTPLSKSVHNTTYSKDVSIDSYDMTPRGPGRALLPSTAEDYNIDDFCSEDSTDNEDEPKKIVPKWAKGAQLQSAIINQYRYPPNLDEIFPDLLDPVNLSNLFNKHKERYFKRTSSAHWNSPIMPPGHISFTKQCRGFN